MSDITFTPEQVKEIRRRIEESKQAQFGACDEGAFGRVRAEGILAVCISLLSRFPLPKVTRFRTFTVAWGGGPPDTYRVNGRQAEWYDGDARKWERSRSVSDIARHMAEAGDWTALAALADVAARPTEEVSE